LHRGSGARGGSSPQRRATMEPSVLMVASKAKMWPAQGWFTTGVMKSTQQDSGCGESLGTQPYDMACVIWKFFQLRRPGPPKRARE
jgi:hypothetical protein